jgi:C-terminal processing protease CtpA/Prc
VIDLSNNYGGEADAAVFLLSWLLGDAEISLEDTFTGAQSTLVYRADVNLDRCFDANDTLDDKHVYVLISPVSFSCGNLVPAVCKYHQAATLIGRTTGGGACVVQPMSTAWGTLFQISGAKRMSFRKNGSFYDIDEGVEPDIYIDRLENLYDREALTAMINALS